MTERAKTILMGCFVIVACLAMIVILLFLRPSVGDGKKTLLVCFTSIEKIQVGTRVTFAGKPVGEVVAIDPIYDARNQPTGRSGHVCFYELELHIDSHTVVYDTDEITVHTTGLLGERTIAIIPKAVAKGQPSYPVTDQILYGKSGDPIEEAIAQVMNIGKKVGDVVDQFKDVLHDSKKEIPAAIKAVRESTNEIRDTFASINSSHMIAHFSDLVNNMESASRRVNHILTEWEESKVGASISHLTKDLAAMTPDLKDTIHNVKKFSEVLSQNGSVAKLFKCDEVYMQLTALMTKANIIFDDVNNYGVLFHQDKSWQRERLKRMNILNALACPQEFKRYFETELNQMNIALNRIHKALCRASNQRCAVLKDKCFQEGCSELLERLDTMDEEFKVYREQLIERCIIQPRCS